MSFRIEADGTLSIVTFFVAHLGLCAAYIQGGLAKLTDFSSAVAEMTHFRLSPPALFAGMAIALELGASALVVTGFLRWVGALVLAGFTLLSTLIALRFWEQPAGEAKHAEANAFFEHLGLIGGLLLVAWFDLSQNSSMSL